MAKLTIDGRQVEAEEGQTILEAAASLGIQIPTLCHCKAIPPAGACQVCVVEVTAGLTTAYYLARLGHKVGVFEKHSEPGGMLRSGIPAFRLPREILDEEIKEVRRSGVRIWTNSTVTSVDRLFKRGYDAVLLAFGAHQGMTMDIPGEDALQVFDCISFLRRVNSGARVQTGNRVAVVGGGSSAMGAARTALRQGAEQVSIIYRRTRAEMPAATEEIDEAICEGVTMQYLAAPVAIRQDTGGLVLECIRMELGPVDESGRPRPQPLKGSEFEVEVDSVIMAIGQRPEEYPNLGCDVNRRGRVRVDEVTLATGRAGVFAAGDVVTGPASVIEAIGAGRAAAQSIDRYLGGQGDIEEVLAPVEEGKPEEAAEEQGERPRTKVPQRPVAERLADSGEVKLGYTEEMAIAEARRCLRCDMEEIED